MDIDANAAPSLTTLREVRLPAVPRYEMLAPLRADELEHRDAA